MRSIRAVVIAMVATASAVVGAIPASATSSTDTPVPSYTCGGTVTVGGHVLDCKDGSDIIVIKTGSRQDVWALDEPDSADVSGVYHIWTAGSVWSDWIYDGWAYDGMYGTNHNNGWYTIRVYSTGWWCDKFNGDRWFGWYSC
jgi:hypothetical protein